MPASRIVPSVYLYGYFGSFACIIETPPALVMESVFLFPFETGGLFEYLPYQIHYFMDCLQNMK